MKNEIVYWTTLLDDEDEGVALDAMAHLLEFEEAAGEALAELQESENPLVRKRVHQLQAAMTARKRRRDFLKLVATPDLKLEEGLFEVHLLWYDNDNVVELQELFDNFIADAAPFRIRELGDLGYFFRTAGVRITKETSLAPDNYCLGPALEELCGSEAFWTAMGYLLGRHNNLTWQMARSFGEFGIYNEASGEFLPMRRQLAVRKIGSSEVVEVIKNEQILRYMGGILFTHAVLSDNFRYVQTIGQSLTATPDCERLDFLPYPYSSEEEEKEN